MKVKISTALTVVFGLTLTSMANDQFARPTGGGCTSNEPASCNYGQFGRTNFSQNNLYGARAPVQSAPAWQYQQPRNIAPYSPLQALPPGTSTYPTTPGVNWNRTPASNSVRTPTIPAGMEGIAKLPPAEQMAALKQRICPVTKQPLGSMGKPIRVQAGRRSVFVCCEGCTSSLRQNPGKYLQGVIRQDFTVVR